MGKPLRFFLGGLAGLFCLLVLALLGYGSLGWADLGESASPGNRAQARGRALLREAAMRQGLAAWSRFRVMEAVEVDEWPSGSPWWPASRQRFRVRRLLGTFTSQVELLDGPGAGEVWGIQSWRSYRIPAGSDRVRFASERAIEFYLPALQYFDELPFRLLAADRVADLGSAELFGRRYDRVLVTWSRFEPHATHDQYELWIDPETRRIEKATYTLRDAERFSPFAFRPLFRARGIGTIHFDDYREVQGVWLPATQVVAIGRAEEARPTDRYVHRIRVGETVFDGFDPSGLTPDPSLPPPSDTKPANVYGGSSGGSP